MRRHDDLARQLEEMLDRLRSGFSPSHWAELTAELDEIRSLGHFAHRGIRAASVTKSEHLLDTCRRSLTRGCLAYFESWNGQLTNACALHRQRCQDRLRALDNQYASDRVVFAKAAFVRTLFGRNDPPIEKLAEANWKRIRADVREVEGGYDKVLLKLRYLQLSNALAVRVTSRVGEMIWVLHEAILCIAVVVLGLGWLANAVGDSLSGQLLSPWRQLTVGTLMVVAWMLDRYVIGPWIKDRVVRRRRRDLHRLVDAVVLRLSMGRCVVGLLKYNMPDLDTQLAPLFVQHPARQSQQRDASNAG